MIQDLERELTHKLQRVTNNSNFLILIIFQDNLQQNPVKSHFKSGGLM